MDGRNEIACHGDGTVVKHHGGADGAARSASAAVALRQAAAHGLPVPQVRRVAGRDLTMTAVAGATTGAALLGGSAGEVLRAIGGFARRLHGLPPPDELVAAAGHAADGVWVHGDLCPVNVLLRRDGELAAVVDWEDSRVGDPLVDLAWTEWLVRTWHRPVVPRLGVLYDAYGGPAPPADERRGAMAVCLRRQAAREVTPAGRAVWDRRAAELADLDLGL